MSLSLGSQLGPYEVLAKLGEGGMGEVYRARDTRLGRDVAIKVLPPSTTDEGRLQRFEQEARATAALNHPNILAVFDIGRAEGGPYIVAELLEGESLRDGLARGPIPVRKAIDYAVQIARGLAAAHDKGIVHRDLKPDNLFVTSAGHLKILDFGLAKLAEPEATLTGQSVLPTTPPATTPGVVLGTVGYMSPEQVRGAAADHRADLFAFGAVLYEMLSGRPPFARATAPETMTAILREEPQDVSVSGSFPIGLQRIIGRCLEKDPSARFQSAGDLAFALEALSFVSEPVAAAPTSRSRSSSRLAWIAVAAVAALAALAVAVAVYMRPTGDAPRRVRLSIQPPEGWRMDPEGPPGIPVSISPNGRVFAGIARREDGQSRIWVRPLDTLEVKVLEGTEDAGTVIWSPDSNSIAFPARGALKRIDVAGGVATRVTDVVPNAMLSGTWTRSGDILLGSAQGILRVPASGGAATTIIPTAEGEAFSSLPIMLPDGKHVLFTAGVGDEVRGGARRRLVAASLESGERTVILDTDRYVAPIAVARDHLLFIRANAIMAQPFDVDRLSLSDEAVQLADRVRLFSERPYALAAATETGVLAFVPTTPVDVHQLAWFDRTGRQIASVGERANYSNVELSSDDRQAIVAVLDPGRRTRDIWLFELARGMRTRFTFDPGEERTAIWSPKGDQIVFNAQRKATERDLFMRASNGSGTEQTLLADGISKDAMSWTPDGRFLLYRASGKTGNDIWVLPAGGKPYAFIATPAQENYGRFSPDGRWVAYTSNESGVDEIYVVPFPGPGGKYQVSSAGGALPRWRGDGREIFYLAPDRTVTAVAVDGTTAGFRVGAPTGLFRAPVETLVGYQYAVARDGQRFLVNTVGNQPPPTVTIETDWPSLLKK
jgi:Tol biopolymer transport system component